MRFNFKWNSLAMLMFSREIYNIPLEVLQVDAICQNFSVAEIFNIEPNTLNG